jgi:hypothetical protein
MKLEVINKSPVARQRTSIDFKSNISPGGS